MEIDYSRLPDCPVCEEGKMLPMYDFIKNEGGQPIVYVKGWACSKCENNRFLHMGMLVKHQMTTVVRQER